jgi:hypothetical protein
MNTDPTPPQPAPEANPEAFRKGRSDPAYWKCECGKTPADDNGDWRWSGYSWQHHHGYPIGHVDAEYLLPVGPTCEWKHDESEWKWEGQCGAAWQFTDDGPVENEMRFCPGCGRRVEVKKTTNQTEQ